MSLPSVDDLAEYLRLDEDDRAAEEELLTRLLASARALVEQLTIVPIEETDLTYVDQSQSGVQRNPVTVLMFPYRPIGAEVAVTDRSGTVVDPTTYSVDAQAGFVRANYGVTFPSGPYTLAGTYGLELLRGYATVVEPSLSQNILDVAADLYQRRSPGAVSEKAGDTTVTWQPSEETLGRVKASIKALRLPVGAV